MTLGPSEPVAATVRTQLWSLSAFSTHRRVDISEDVELNHDREEEEDAVAEEADDAESSVKAPPAEVDGGNLQTYI